MDIALTQRSQRRGPIGSLNDANTRPLKAPTHEIAARGVVVDDESQSIM